MPWTQEERLVVEALREPVSPEEQIKNVLRPHLHKFIGQPATLEVRQHFERHARTLLREHFRAQGLCEKDLPQVTVVQNPEDPAAFTVRIQPPFKVQFYEP